MNIFKSIACALAACAAITFSPITSAGIITFDDVLSGSSFLLPATAPPPNTHPTSSLFSDGIEVWLDFHQDISNNAIVPSGPAMIVASFNGSPSALSLNNSKFYIDFLASGIGPVTEVTFDYQYLGGRVHANVNNFPRFLNVSSTGLNSFPASYPHGPAVLKNSVTTTFTGGVEGTFTFTALSGLIDSISFGGQELIIDNITYTPIPEPTSFVILSLASVALINCRK
ncbi:hypothetical protein JD969_07900 [Planctomycetota bacterium]|nr:hypothetical protein JD969_07900 [Planctomycetota bacterium]